MAQSDMQPHPLQRSVHRKPKRITITIPDAVYEQLGAASVREGRSMSNHASFLLERAIQG